MIAHNQLPKIWFYIKIIGYVTVSTRMDKKYGQAVKKIQTLKFLKVCFMKFKNKAKLKATLLSAAAIATSCLIGVAACTTTPDKDNNEDDKTVTKQDVQLIKNGNFEFYDDNDGLYPISSPDNWSSGSNGSSSGAMGGVINTSKKSWDYLTDPELPKTLEANNDLDSDDENKKDYNGALEGDMLYKNTHKGTLKDDDEDKDTTYIDNPFTHEYKYDNDGNIIKSDGSVQTTYEKDGKTYIDEECTQEFETSVLMLHNYRSSYYNGTETYFSSSSTITLEARTAAKFSVWVKTDELYFDGTENKRTEVVNEHGAYIQVNTTVGGNSLDNFYIRNINTKQLNPENENNGWVQYTVFIQASSFASTEVSINLGLGQNEIYTVEGYAFFDDAEITPYESVDKMIEIEKIENFETLTKNSTANLLAPDSKSEFRVDKVSMQTDNEEGKKDYDYNFADRHFYIDLTSSSAKSTSPIAFEKANVKAGLTVEKTTTNGAYVSSKNSPLLYRVNELDYVAENLNLHLPAHFPGRKTDNDVLATVNVTSENYQFSISGYTDKYNKIMTDALASAASLPSANGNTSALVMLSANGAAYEAELNNEAFNLEAGEYAMLTFWIKTSDMDGKTAATVTVKDADDEDNSSDFNIDTTTVDTVTINDREDIYNGWVECFIRVENTAEVDKQFKVSFNFGNTTIKGTSEADYKYGWITVANASLMKLDKDVYGYTSGVSHSASLTLSETEKQSSNHFDSEQGDKNVIKHDLAIPSSYTGVNGASAEVVKLDLGGEEYKEENRVYDETNRNPYAGLLNKENLSNYREGCAWYSIITALQDHNHKSDDEVWNILAGNLSVQPLLIVNANRKFFNDAVGKVYNYGYIGGNSSVSSDGYTAVSVRVKASAGAIANVYLVDTDASNKHVLDFSMPKYTYWYDDDGNILKDKPAEKASIAEIKENIAYTLRADGLYENGDGKLYANYYNLEKYYGYDLEYETFYNEDGIVVKFENLVQGETYYANADKTAYAPHYLIAGDAGKAVYKYVSGLGTSATYYYMVNGKADTSKLVYGVDVTGETAKLRYDNTDKEKNSYPYQFTIDTIANPDYAGKWVTVTFYIHAGSETKNYKLELWSGYRDEQTSGQTAGSYVLFDYNSVSLSETSYNNIIGEYTDAIINEYKNVITDELEKNSDNITEYEKLAGEKSDIFNYEAKYYTYTLYDSASYVPFNADTAEGDESGYAYNYSDYSEELAYLKVENFDDTEYTMSAFVNYSTLDKDIEIGTTTKVDDDNNDNDSTTKNNDTNFWLLLASIILLVAILIAFLAIIIKWLVKKFRRTKKAGKNTYNFNKNKRYVRKYVKANGEVTKVEEGNVDESLLTDKVEEPAEDTPVDETHAEEAPVDETPAEEATANEAVEAPTEEAPVEQAPSTEESSGDGENKE